MSPIRISGFISGILVCVLITVIVTYPRTAPVAITPIDNEQFLFPYPDNTQYHYYQEPIPNSIIEIPAPTWLPYQPVFTINQDGLHERFDYTPEKDVRTFRIATLGDSWTFGQFVNTKDNYSETLETLLNEQVSCPNWDAFEVINLGVPSYDIQYAVERFRRTGAKYDPDLLIWLVIENDFDEIGEEVQIYLTEHLGSGNGGSVNAMGEKRLLNTYTQARAHIVQKWGLKGLYEYQKQALEKIHSYFQKEILFLSFRNVSSVDNEFRPILVEQTKEHINVEWFESHLDLERNKLLLPDFHPNTRGHHAIAENVFHYIMSRYLTDCTITD